MAAFIFYATLRVVSPNESVLSAIDVFVVSGTREDVQDNRNESR